MGQDVTGPPSISMANMTPECVNTFSLLGSTLSSDLLIDTEVSIRLAKAAALMAKLLKRHTAHKASGLASLLAYSSETWTTYTRQEKHVSTCDVPNIKIQKYARLNWFSYVHGMDLSRLPGAVQLSTGSRLTGCRPRLRFGTVCKRNMKEAGRH